MRIGYIPQDVPLEIRRSEHRRIRRDVRTTARVRLRQRLLLLARFLPPDALRCRHCSSMSSRRCSGSLSWLAISSPSIASLAYSTRPSYSGRDSVLGEFAGQRRTADQNRHIDAGRSQILRGNDHLLRRFDQQAGQTDRVRLLLAVRFDQLFRRHFDAEVDDFISVVGQE